MSEKTYFSKTCSFPVSNVELQKIVQTAFTMKGTNSKIEIMKLT